MARAGVGKGMHMHLTRRRPHRLLAITTVALATIVAIAPTADARHHAPKRTFDQTFPVATRLCAKASSGALPRKLASSADGAKTACATLHARFDAAVATYGTSTAGLADQAKTIVATAKTACAAPATTNDPAPSRRFHGQGPGATTACHAARRQARTQLRALRRTAKRAVRTYRTSVRTARHTFWGTIHGLRGGATQPTDSDSSTTVPSSPAIPSDSAA